MSEETLLEQLLKRKEAFEHARLTETAAYRGLLAVIEKERKRKEK
jgi:hypothetical protein